MSMLHQRTLRRACQCVGIGLHTGRPVALSLLPAPADHGLVFARADDRGRRIRALAENVVHTHFATTLAEGGASIATTEHLLSAMNAAGVHNALIEVDGPEVPILDGSAAPFLLMLREAGIQELAAPCRPVVIDEPLSLSENGSTIRVEPAVSFEVDYRVEFQHPVIGGQRFQGRIDLGSYIEEIAPARTFCLLRDVEAMRRQGLALGGSLDNAVVVGDHGVLNDALRFPDEFVRHKVLDLVGDLALLGAPLLGRVVAVRAGHRLHTLLARAIRARVAARPALAAVAPSATPALGAPVAGFAAAL
jgi:UDP-3-O-[3-hydroxymyristoyl] N-acetylglucosamine deacetylase